MSPDPPEGLNVAGQVLLARRSSVVRRPKAIVVKFNR